MDLLKKSNIFLAIGAAIEAPEPPCSITTEIAYFGLLPKFIGKGLGGGFLSYAVEKAWEFKKKRIWVHTCNYDHPNALKNYKARGFEIYKETPS